MSFTPMIDPYAQQQTEPLPEPEQIQEAPASWIIHAKLLWKNRRLLALVTVIAAVLSIVIALAIPKRYESVTRIMPPEQQGSSAMMLNALASRGGGGLGSLFGLLSGRGNNNALFVELLHSGTVSGHLIDRFHLQRVYRKRYVVDTAKYLARRTTIFDDKKSGVITIAVQDTDRVRARDLAQGYLDELNQLVTLTSTSTAHQERIFIERRLHSVEADLERAQLELSEFSSRNSTIDIKEQTRAMVDAAARVQGEVLVDRSSLDALRQIYGDGNVRVRETEARIATLERELARMSGSSAPLTTPIASTSGDVTEGNDEPYPPLRQLPRLAVPYADLYRRVKVQETVYELLTQQYEMARIEEARDIPIVSVIDPPGTPEKKAFPPRLLIVALLTSFSFAITAAIVLMRNRWDQLGSDDPRKLLAQDIWSSLSRPKRSSQ